MNRSYAEDYKSRKSKFTNKSSELKSMTNSKYHNQFSSKNLNNTSGLEKQGHN